MRLVTIDNGNTNPSVGLFTNNILTQVIPLADYQQLNDDFILISSVGKDLKIKATFDLKTKRTSTHFFDMPVHYSETLGEDRVIAAFGVFKKIHSHESRLIIDAGTFMTCDLVSENGFIGGYIFPGITHFLKIYGESAQLPVLAKNELSKISLEIPQTTSEAILKATYIYIKSSIESVIEKFQPQKIIITGGDCKLISEILNSSIPSEIDHHLIHLTLSLIYQSQLHQD